MFREPIQEIDFEGVTTFCEQGIRERLFLEYKGSFPNDLEKTISAFANTQGGVILIGVEEEENTGEPIVPIQGVALEKGLHERVVQKAFEAIRPPVFPEVKVCPFASSEGGTLDRAVIVVRVAESAEAPHAVSRGRKAYRRIDNISKPEELIGVERIAEFLERRKAAREQRDCLVGKAGQRSDFFRTRDSQLQVERYGGSKPPSRQIAICPLFPRTIADHQDLLVVSRNHWCRTGYQLQQFPDMRPSPVPEGVAAYGEGDGLYVEVNYFGLVFWESLLFEEFRRKNNILWSKESLEALLDVLAVSLSVYRDWGFWGELDLRASITNIRGRELKDSNDRFYIESRPYPDADFLWKENISVPGLFEDILSGEFRVVKSMQQSLWWAFGFDNAAERAQEDLERYQARMWLDRLQELAGGLSEGGG